MEDLHGVGPLHIQALDVLLRATESRRTTPRNLQPFRDPRALEGQRGPLTAVARRYRGVDWIHWDLINEPSYAPPEGLWSTRAIRDPYEERAWKEWVRERHGEDVTVLRDRWQDGSLDVLAIPGDGEVYYSQIRDGKRPQIGRAHV